MAAPFERCAAQPYTGYRRPFFTLAPMTIMGGVAGALGLPMISL
jgi:hypothetical protein